MDKQHLLKNRLDLEYHGEAQKTNAFLILLTTGLLGFIGTFMWVKDNNIIYFGFLITITIFIFGLIFFIKSNRRMKEILEEKEKIQ